MTAARAALGLLLLLLALVGCGDERVDAGAASETAAPASGGTRLVIEPVRAPTFEGAVVTVSVRERRGDGVAAPRPLVRYVTQLPERQQIVFSQLAPGTYDVTARLQECAGSCDYLDPPSSRCLATFRVRGRTNFTARARFDEQSQCRIVVQQR